MDYKQTKKYFKSRAKGRDHKMLYNGCVQLKHNDSTGQFEFYRVQYEWAKDKTGNYMKTALPSVLFATITADSVVELHVDLATRDIQARNLFHKISGVYTGTDSGKYKMYQHQVRATHKLGYIPVSAGFKFNAATGKVLWHADDMRKVTNKEAAKPIIHYVREVIKVMEVLHRVGAFDDKEKIAWSKRREAINNSKVSEMTDEHMALLAEAAYTKATSTTSMPPSRRWEYDLNQPIGRLGGEQMRFKFVPVNIPEAERQAVYLRRLKSNAAKYLREYLKDKLGAYDMKVMHEQKTPA